MANLEKLVEDLKGLTVLEVSKLSRFCRFAASDGGSAGSSLPDGVKAPGPPVPAETTDLSALGLPDNTHSPSPSGIDEPHADPAAPGKDVPPGEPAPQPSPVAAQSPAEATPPAAQPPAQAAEPAPPLAPVPVPETPQVPDESGLQSFTREVIESITKLKEQNDALADRLVKLEDASTPAAAEPVDLGPVNAKLGELTSKVQDLDAKTLHEQELITFRDRLDRNEQSVSALADRTSTLETGFQEVAKVADSLRTADLEPRMQKAEAAIAKGGTGGDNTTLAKLFSGDEDTAKEMAAKLDHLWKQNGNA